MIGRVIEIALDQLRMFGVGPQVVDEGDALCSSAAGTQQSFEERAGVAFFPFSLIERFPGAIFCTALHLKHPKQPGANKNGWTIAVNHLPTPWCSEPRRRISVCLPYLSGLSAIV